MRRANTRGVRPNEASKEEALGGTMGSAALKETES